MTVDTKGASKMFVKLTCRLQSGIILHKPEEIFAYGIKAPNNGTKSLLMCIQAYFLKHLFFDNKKGEKK
jgi:hypothetical protein